MEHYGMPGLQDFYVCLVKIIQDTILLRAQ